MSNVKGATYSGEPTEVSCLQLFLPLLAPGFGFEAHFLCGSVSLYSSCSAADRHSSTESEYWTGGHKHHSMG